jgi:serine/threonine-protein kinase
VAGVEVGSVLAGKYRVEKILGMGGMGVVVAAQHMHLDERVAIKFLLPETLEHAEAVERFAREARAAVKIKSEYVARVIDVGLLETGAPYMVMEYLDGVDLATWLKERGPQPVEQAVEFILQACEAIAEAHALGIVHRDLKPANMFLIRRADGLTAVKVLDFGISKMSGTHATSMQMTKTATVMGSPLYMCPEQMQSARAVDGRADIWALGVILHETLTGQLPFSGATLPEVCFKIATEPPAPLRQIRPDAPAQLEAAVMKCLEKDRERRFRNVAELAAAVVAFGPARSRPSVDRIARTVQHAAGVPAVAGTFAEAASSTWAAPADDSAGTMNPWGGDASPRRSSRALLWGFMTGLAVVGVVLFLVMRFLGAPSADTAARDTPAASASPAGAVVAAPRAPAPTAASEPPAAEPQAEPPPQPILRDEPPPLRVEVQDPAPRKVKLPPVRTASPAKVSRPPPRATATPAPEPTKPPNDLGGRT